MLRRIGLSCRQRVNVDRDTELLAIMMLPLVGIYGTCTARVSKQPTLATNPRTESINPTRCSVRAVRFPAVMSIVASITRLSRFAELLFVFAALPLAPAVRAQTLVVIVNPSIGVQHLSRREALDIFLGRYRSFPSGASALPIDLDITSTERRQFYLLLAHKDQSDMSAYWARLAFSGKLSPPFSVTDARMAVDIVAHNPNAIAYVDRTAVDNRVRIALEVTP